MGRRAITREVGRGSDVPMRTLCEGRERGSGTRKGEVALYNVEEKKKRQHIFKTYMRT